MKLKLICRVEAAEAADGDEKVMNSRRSFFARLKKTKLRRGGNDKSTFN
jgi:hypothetical protein